MRVLPVVWRRSLKIFASLLGIYTLLRLLFFLANLKSFQGTDWREIVEAFIFGLRFDLVAIAFSNLPVFILLLMPAVLQHKVWFVRLKMITFVTINVIFLACNIADLELYQFTGRRMTLEVFRLVGDIKSQLLQMATYYWYLTLVAALVIYALFKLFPHFKKEVVRPWWRRLVGGFLLMIMLVLAARGGLQLKPLKTTNAFIFSEEALGVLALNTTFTLIRSRKGEALKAHNYFVNEAEIDQIIPVAVSWDHTPNNDNVVLIVLESFALEYMGAANGGKGYTPFLDKLAAKSRFFRNGFANGRRSIDAIPSLLSGLPSWLQAPFITSNLSGNQVEGLGHILKHNGYSTAFFHGAENGTMYFDSYAQRVGFEKYYGLNEYPNKKDFDGNWGVYDEPFLNYTLEKLGEMKSPFGALVFTLSSHQPYSVPEKYQGRFPKGTLEIHESIGYTDFALGQFFSQAEKQPWFKNTLFVITADHTSKTDRPGYEDELGRYRVPILFYHPGKLLPETDPAQPVQHVDIPLTIMHLLGLRPEKWTRFGHSVFASEPAWVMNRSETSFWYLDRENYLQWSEEAGLKVFTHQDTRDPQLSSDEGEDQQKQKSRRLHALLQYFFNSMMANQLSVVIPVSDD